MSSTGASYANLYVQQKRQKEKLMRMEQERGGEKAVSSGVDDCNKSSAGSRNKKVHPGNFLSPDCSPGSGGRKD
ncbi:UNVERIFIED_CONTAM: hypothetical protein Slati_0008900 [Sesamum latifolium]|uniref:Uncharacterized protein n=1 Tax=Sesamum latifolium TaxID=2727402 RepID=A0AAW2Y6B1_9LAMI